MVPPAGFEPATRGLGNHWSGHTRWADDLRRCALQRLRVRRYGSDVCSVAARLSGDGQAQPTGCGTSVNGLLTVVGAPWFGVPSATAHPQTWSAVARVAATHTFQLRIRRLGVRVPSGAQHQQASDVPEQRPVDDLLPSTVDDRVLLRCSSDADTYGRGPSSQPASGPTAAEQSGILVGLPWPHRGGTRGVDPGSHLRDRQPILNQGPSGQHLRTGLSGDPAAQVAHAGRAPRATIAADSGSPDRPGQRSCGHLSHLARCGRRVTAPICRDSTRHDDSWLGRRAHASTAAPRRTTLTRSTPRSETIRPGRQPTTVATAREADRTSSAPQTPRHATCKPGHRRGLDVVAAGGDPQRTLVGVPRIRPVHRSAAGRPPAARPDNHRLVERRRLRVRRSSRSGGAAIACQPSATGDDHRRAATARDGDRPDPGRTTRRPAACDGQ